LVQTSSIFMQSLVEIRCRRREKEKLGVLFLFVCLFVCYTLDLEQRFSLGLDRYRAGARYLILLAAAIPILILGCTNFFC